MIHTTQYTARANTGYNNIQYINLQTKGKAATKGR